MERGYIIFDRIDIHCEIQAVPFAELSKMQSGEPSAAIRERVIRARTIADLTGSEKVESMHIAEAIGYRNLDRGDWAERGI
jgi:magnesium chelatase family protein